MTNSTKSLPREPSINEAPGLKQNWFYTSALATAKFLDSQVQRAAYVIGEPGIQNALYEVGITYNDVDPDYVVASQAATISNDDKGYTPCVAGAKLIGTNMTLRGHRKEGSYRLAERQAAPIELATGRQAYYVGKPNPLIMRTGFRMLCVHSEEAAIIGDRMDTAHSCWN